MELSYRLKEVQDEFLHKLSLVLLVNDIDWFIYLFLIPETIMLTIKFSSFSSKLVDSMDFIGLSTTKLSRVLPQAWLRFCLAGTPILSTSWSSHTLNIHSLTLRAEKSTWKWVWWHNHCTSIRHYHHHCLKAPSITWQCFCVQHQTLQLLNTWCCASSGVPIWYRNNDYICTGTWSQALELDCIIILLKRFMFFGPCQPAFP